MIPHSRPWITADDHAAVHRVLAEEMIGQGERCARFERRLASWVGCTSTGVATGSGTAALTLALLGLDVGPGDEVVVPTYVCRSVLTAIKTVGADPVISDTGPHWVATPEAMAPHVSRRTRALIVPHIYGIFADIAGFRSLGVPVIEDCAQAVESDRAYAVAGDVATFSFHPTKCLTTGEGGMAIARSEAVSARMRGIRDGHMSPRVASPLSDLAAALGCAQLDRYASGVMRRREIAAGYRRRLDAVAPDVLVRQQPERSMFFRFPISLHTGRCDNVAARFAGRGVVVRRGVDRLVHREIGLSDARFPVATELFATTISLPIYPALTDADAEVVAAAAVAVLADTRAAGAPRCVSA